MIPNLLHEVDAGRLRWPQAWRDAHTGSPHTEDFIRLLAAHCAIRDPKWGLNGKRGDPRDISDDILAYRGEGSAIDAVNGGPMEIIDVIGGAGGPNPVPAWNVGPGGPGDRGTWMRAAAGVDPPVITPCPDPSAHVPKPPPPKPVYAGDPVFDAMGLTLEKDMRRAGRPGLDGQSGRWFGRVSYDYLIGGMSMVDAIAKHRVEWCAILGVPVL